MGFKDVLLNWNFSKFSLKRVFSEKKTSARSLIRCLAVPKLWLRYRVNLESYCQAISWFYGE